MYDNTYILYLPPLSGVNATTVIMFLLLLRRVGVCVYRTTIITPPRCRDDVDDDDGCTHNIYPLLLRSLSDDCRVYVCALVDPTRDAGGYGRWSDETLENALRYDDR